MDTRRILDNVHATVNTTPLITNSLLLGGRHSFRLSHYHVKCTVSLNLLDFYYLNLRASLYSSKVKSKGGYKQGLLPCPTPNIYSLNTSWLFKHQGVLDAAAIIFMLAASKHNAKD